MTPAYRSGYTGHGSSETWRQSYLANLQCREEIDRMLWMNWNDRENKLAEGTAEMLCTKCGIDRVGSLLAYAVRKRLWEKEFSYDIRSWAGSFHLPAESASYGVTYLLTGGAAKIEQLCAQYRDYVQSLHLYGNDICVPGSDKRDYTHQLLVIRPEVLSDACKRGEYQLFFARSGFGCEEGKNGSRVFGFFLRDGEETSLHRDDFYGIASDDKLPLWATQAMTAIRLEEAAGNAYGMRRGYAQIAIT